MSGTGGRPRPSPSRGLRDSIKVGFAEGQGVGSRTLFGQCRSGRFMASSNCPGWELRDRGGVSRCTGHCQHSRDTPPRALGSGSVLPSIGMVIEDPAASGSEASLAKGTGPNMPQFPAAVENASNGGFTEQESFSLEHDANLALAHERVEVTHFPDLPLLFFAGTWSSALMGAPTASHKTCQSMVPVAPLPAEEGGSGPANALKSQSLSAALLAAVSGRFQSCAVAAGPQVGHC